MAATMTSWDEGAPEAAAPPVVQSWDAPTVGPTVAPANVMSSWDAPAPAPRSAPFKRTMENIGLLYPVAGGATTAMTGGLGFVAGGVAGAYATLENQMADWFGKTRRWNPNQVREDVQNAMTYEGSPRSQEFAGTLAYPFEKLHDVARYAGEKVQETAEKVPVLKEWAPALATATETGIEGGGVIFGPKAVAKGARAASEADVNRAAKYTRPEDAAGLDQPFEEPRPSPTGTSSGVPVKLDALIAEAQRNAAGIPTPPKNLATLADRTPATTGTSSGIPLPTDRLIAQAEQDWQIPTPPRNLADLAKKPELPQQPLDLQDGRYGQSRTPTVAVDEAVPDFFLEEAPYKIDLPRSEVRGDESGGENRKVFETVRFKGPLEQLLANAGRDWELPERKDAAMRDLRNGVDQAPADSPLAPLKGFSYDKLDIAARQYWREARERLLQARKENPEAMRIQVRAPDAERVKLYGEEPPRGGTPEPSVPPGDIPPPPSGAERVAVPAEAHDMLRTMAEHSDWAERGGEKFGAKTAFDERIGIASRDEVQGRSQWLGKPDWAKSGSGANYTKAEIKAVVEKAINGERLGPKQRLLVEGMLDEIESNKPKQYDPFAGDDVRWGEDMREAGERGEEMSDAEALKAYGPGTFGSNPMFDPAAIKDTVKWIAGGLEKPTQQVRKWVNAVQAVPESAKGVLAPVWKYAREVAFAKERAQRDSVVTDTKPEFVRQVKEDYAKAVDEAKRLNPKYSPEAPKTLREAIVNTERARREVAKMRMQRELYERGFLVKGSEGKDWKEFKRPIGAYNDLIGPDGQLMRVRRDAYDVVDQMVGAHDIAEQRAYEKSLLGAVESTSHGIVGWLMMLPQFHIMTTAGKGVIYSAPGINRSSIWNFGAKAVKSLSDRKEFEDMMKHGFQPFALRAKLEPMGAMPGTVERGMKAIGMSKPYGAYQWIHKNLVANAVNTIQASFYHMRIDQLKRAAEKAGEKMTPERMDVFKSTAAQDSNMIGGNLPREELNRAIFRGLGATLFSRGLSVSTIRMLTRSFENNRIIEAYAREKGFSKSEAATIMQRNRNFILGSLMLDYIALQATANGINWYTTSQTDEPEGKPGGHFVWENQGSDKSQMFLPTNIYLYRETDKKGEPTGRGVYMSSPIRTMRDIIEWGLAPFEIAQGKPPKVLHNKISVPLSTVLDSYTGEDWAGRPLSGPIDVAANAASKMTPSPFQEVPKAAGESLKSGNWSFTAEAIKKALNGDTAIPVLLGMQPRIAPNDPTTIMLSTKQSKEEKDLWARVSRVKQMARSMDPEVREAEIEAVLESARKLQMSGQRINQISRVMRSEAPSRSQRKAASTYERREAESRQGEIPAPPGGI